MITDHLMKRQSGEYDPEVVKRLKLENCSIVSISNLNKCASLVELSLSMNEVLISAISGLNSLTSLQRLDLSYNKISKIENIDGLFNLVYLDLRCNKISNTSDARNLTPLMNLESLYVFCEDSRENNPLSYLDGSHISLEHACSMMEAKLAGIVADPRLCESPPLEPWFGDAPPSTENDSIKFDAVFDSLESALEESEKMLTIDSSHLLKNATTAVARAKATL